MPQSCGMWKHQADMKRQYNEICSSPLQFITSSKYCFRTRLKTPCSQWKSWLIFCFVCFRLYQETDFSPGNAVRRKGFVGLIWCVTGNSSVLTFGIQIKWGVFREKAAFLRHYGDFCALVLVLPSTSVPFKQYWLLELPAVAITSSLLAALALYHQFASAFHTYALKRKERVTWRTI